MWPRLCCLPGIGRVLRFTDEGVDATATLISVGVVGMSERLQPTQLTCLPGHGSNVFPLPLAELGRSLHISSSLHYSEGN